MPMACEHERSGQGPPPCASARIIDGLDVLDPDFEDDHDAALSVANVAASEARQDAANPQ
jgi:hypothetical protein